MRHILVLYLVRPHAQLAHLGGCRHGLTSTSNTKLAVYAFHLTLQGVDTQKQRCSGGRNASGLQDVDQGSLLSRREGLDGGNGLVLAEASGKFGHELLQLEGGRLGERAQRQ